MVDAVACACAHCWPSWLLRQELDLSCTSLSWLPGAISSLAGLTALRLSQNFGLESLPQELTALSKLAVFDARWASKKTPHLRVQGRERGGGLVPAVHRQCLAD